MIDNLIVNEHYWALYEQISLRKQEFLVPDKPLLDDRVDTKKMMRDLALILKSIDNNKECIYGIEIKANGGSRSSRIPMVRFSDGHKSIWKIVKKMTEIEQGFIDLEILLSHLSSSKRNLDLSLPKKIILFSSPEEIFSKDTLNYNFIINKAIQSHTLVITLECINFIINQNIGFDFDTLLSYKNHLLTREEIQNGSNNK